MIGDVVTDTTGGVPTEFRRIVAGEQNEVYDVDIKRAAPIIVKISHTGDDGHDREEWALDQCAARGIAAPGLYGRRHIEVDGHHLSVIVMEKLPGRRLADLERDDVDLSRVLGDVGEWMMEFHAIPATGLGYVDATGTGDLTSIDEWIDHLEAQAERFVVAAQGVGLDAGTVTGWVAEIVDALTSAVPRVNLIHNDLLAAHVLVDDGRFSGMIDFGEVAREPAIGEFAKWDFAEGDRFPVALIRAGYGDDPDVGTSSDPAFRALWLATGLWRMAWYHSTGYPDGVQASLDRIRSRY